MKSEASQAQHVCLTEGVQLIFDQVATATPNSSGSRSRSSSSDSSYTSSESSCSSHRSHHRQPRHRSSSSSSRTRSRSHPRCHRASGRSCSRHRCRAQSRSYSPSPDCPSHGRYRRRSPSSTHSSRQRRSQRRSRSRSSSYRRGTHGFVGRYRCRFSPSSRKSYRDYRKRSRSPEYSAVRLSQKEKIDLLNIAKENAAKVLGVRPVELPASISSVQQKPDCTIDDGVRADSQPMKRQDGDKTNEDDSHAPRTSPIRKPIAFSINNMVAKPSSSQPFHATESKVTSRADSVGNRKPYGHWVPVKKTSPNKS
ncbi:hypothetical protein P4O66_013217 [Electrophorus voltai]|uniref:Arginine/serine-rich protein 1 n=1 Tax=Electrophorus voltai TaxID=2609070 RepID=A0AAD9DS45_9TELE|nr:hypothetical protein P4O66_013217 [Electrophorus voltai]